MARLQHSPWSWSKITSPIHTTQEMPTQPVPILVARPLSCSRREGRNTSIDPCWGLVRCAGASV